MFWSKVSVNPVETVSNPKTVYNDIFILPKVSTLPVSLLNMLKLYNMYSVSVYKYPLQQGKVEFGGNMYVSVSVSVQQTRK